MLQNALFLNEKKFLARGIASKASIACRGAPSPLGALRSTPHCFFDKSNTAFNVYLRSCRRRRAVTPTTTHIYIRPCNNRKRQGQR